VSQQLVTLGAALAVGVAAFTIAHRLRVPAIVPLLAAGVIFGPYALGLVVPATLGAGLKTLILVAVSVILFEGSLSLRLPEYRAHRGPITRLVTLGAVVTWVGATLAARFCFDITWSTALLLGSILIVTGPTVVIPLLRTVRPRANIREILRWEGILIDPIGAIAAVVALDFVLAGEAATLGGAVFSYLRRAAVGTALGVAAALLIDRALRARNAIVSPDLVNPFALAVVLAAVVGAEVIAPESALFTSTAAGVILANLHPPRLHEIERFKGELTTVLLALLFVVLAARLEPRALADLGAGGALFLLALLAVRGVAVFASTVGAGVTGAERAFMTWMSPRGVVAASVASLFSEYLRERGDPDGGRIVLSAVFLVIGGTVIVQGLLARPVGRLLGVLAPDARGVLIVGAGPFGIALGKALADSGVDVVVLDRSDLKAGLAEGLGLVAYAGDALSPATYADIDLESIGAFLAATPNDEVNALAAGLASETLRVSAVLQLPTGSAAVGAAGRSAMVRFPLAFGERFTLEALETALEKGARIVARKVETATRAADLRLAVGTDFRPLIVLDKSRHPGFVRDRGAKVPAGIAVGIEGLPPELGFLDDSLAGELPAPAAAPAPAPAPSSGSKP